MTFGAVGVDFFLADFAVFVGIVAFAEMLDHVFAAAADPIWRSSGEQDRRDDQGLEIQARYGRSFELSPDSGLSLEAGLKAEVYDQVDDVGQTSILLAAGYRRKLGLGLLAPWVRLGAEVERIESRSDLRDSWSYSAGLSSGKRLGERWSIYGGVLASSRDGDEDDLLKDGGPGPSDPAGPVDGPGPSDGPGPIDGPGQTKPADVFDQDSWEVFLGADYQISDLGLLTLEYRFIDGDVTSTAVPYDRVSVMAEAINKDDAFGEDTFAYRLDAETRSITVGINYALSENSALDLSYQHLETEAPGGIDYDKSVVRLRVLFSF